MLTALAIIAAVEFVGIVYLLCLLGKEMRRVNELRRSYKILEGEFDLYKKPSPVKGQKPKSPYTIRAYARTERISDLQMESFRWGRSSRFSEDFLPPPLLDPNFCYTMGEGALNKAVHRARKWLKDGVKLDPPAMPQKVEEVKIDFEVVREEKYRDEILLEDSLTLKKED